MRVGMCVCVCGRGGGVQWQSCDLRPMGMQYRGEGDTTDIKATDKRAVHRGVSPIDNQ